MPGEVREGVGEAPAGGSRRHRPGERSADRSGRPPGHGVDGEGDGEARPHRERRAAGDFRELAARGVTLFISTHLMDEALLCDHLAIMQRGRIIAVNTPNNILQRGHTRLMVQQAGVAQTTSIGSTPHDLATALHGYGLAPDVEWVALEADSLEMVVLNLINEEATA